jgi:hypothetical protein
VIAKDSDGIKQDAALKEQPASRAQSMSVELTTW